MTNRRSVFFLVAISFVWTAFTATIAHAYDPLVFSIQSNLSLLGYQVGKPDGLYGNATKRGISEFQHDNGIPVDGKPSDWISQKILAKARGGA